jgi:hypothetical protein
MMAKSKTDDTEVETENGDLTKAQRAKVKSIRRVGRMAAEFVLTEKNPTDEKIEAVAKQHFIDETNARYKAFVVLTAMLVNEGWAKAA